MKSLSEYLELPYTVILRLDEDGDYVARVDELPGCSAHGKNPQESLENLEEAKTLWISDCLESGQPVPEPAVEEPLPSGKWVQRVPRSLHRKLAALARREGASLNQLVTSILSEAVGSRMAAAPESDREATTAQDSSCWHQIPATIEDLYSGPRSWRQGYFQRQGAVPDVCRLLKRAIPNRMRANLKVERYTHEEEAYRTAQ